MRVIILLALALLLTSCEPAPLYLKLASSGQNLIVQVYEKWWFGLRSRQVPCVHDMTLTRNSDGKVFWRTVVHRPMKTQCEPLRSVVVGRSPEGFYNEVPLTSAFSPGDYTITVQGIGNGSQDFTWPLNQ